MGEVRFLLCGMLAFLVCFVLVLSLTATLSSSFLAISTFLRRSVWAGRGMLYLSVWIRCDDLPMHVAIEPPLYLQR